jgi:hypothetical protein
MSDEKRNNPGEPPKVLMAAIEKLLRPLVKLMLSFQITYPLLNNMLKSIYVDVAEKKFQVTGKRQSDSRINLLTGVHRKDIKRLRNEVREEQSVLASVSTGAEIIAQWLGSKEFLREDGKPRSLALRKTSAEELCFDDLVEKVCKQDIRPRVILDEWLRLGVAHIENEQVILNTGAFTPVEGFAEKVFFFSKNTQDHICASSHNLMGQKPAYFDRSVYYDRLSKQSVQELAELAESLGMQALTAMNKQALAKQSADKNRQGTDFRMNFGIFNFNSRTDATNGNSDDNLD